MHYSDNGSVYRLVANLRSLALDLDDILLGLRPTPEDLAAAPVIVDWEPRLTRTQAPAIRGVVIGHPVIDDGETLVADILAGDPDMTWIRSWAGYYRLGAEAVARPAKPAQQGQRARA